MGETATTLGQKKAKVAQLLLAARKERKLSRHEVARRAGLSTTTIWAYETGKASKFDVIHRICVALDYDLFVTLRIPGAGESHWNLKTNEVATV